MAWSFIGEVSAYNGTSLTVPAGIAAGDIFILWIVGYSSTATIVDPTGFTEIVGNNGAINGALNSNDLLLYRISDGTETSIAIPNGGSKLSVLHVYRGNDTISPIGVSSNDASSASSSIIYDGLSLTHTDGSSLVVAFGFNKTTSGTITTPPTGMINRSYQAGSTTRQLAGFDTNGGVSSWAGDTVNVGASAIWRSTVVEILSSSTPTYSASVAETASGSDSQSETIAFSETITEAATASDSQTETMTTGASVSETSSASDSQSQITGIGVIITETTASNDTVAANYTFTVAISEAVISSDNQSVTMTATVSQTEDANATDTASGSVSYVLTVTETASSEDSQSTALIASLSLAETANSLDAQSEAMTAAVIMTEAAEAVDYPSIGETYDLIIVEDASAMDIITAALIVLGNNRSTDTRWIIDTRPTQWLISPRSTTWRLK